MLRQFGTTAFTIDVNISYANIGTVLAPAVAWLATSQLIGVVAARLRDRTWQYLKTPAMGYQLLLTAGLILIGPVLMSEPTGLMTMLVIVPLLALNWASRQSSQQEYRMLRDPLTGLLNRRGLIVELGDAARARRCAVGSVRADARGPPSCSSVSTSWGMSAARSGAVFMTSFLS